MEDIIDMLYKRAKEIAGQFPLGGFSGNSAGAVGCALKSKNGGIYTGICIDVACSMGFCAEHSAISEMLKYRETEIEYIIAVNYKGNILPPCGRCREFMAQIDPKNADTNVIVGPGKVIKLKDLLPYMWTEEF